MLPKHCLHTELVTGVFRCSVTRDSTAQSGVKERTTGERGVGFVVQEQLVGTIQLYVSFIEAAASLCVFKISNDI